MTPRELLESVAKRFSVMYLSETIQTSLLQEALETYQRIVGPFKKVTTEGTATTLNKPADFLAVAICIDKEGRWHKAIVADTLLQVCTSIKSVAPFTIYYFVNLSEMNIEKDAIPSDCIPLLKRYLNILLEIPNTARARAVMATTGVPVELTDGDTLESRKLVIEEELEESQAIIPMATVY